MRARIRSVHPGQLDDRHLAHIPGDEGFRARCERTWVRLQMVCDDYGRHVDDPFLIRNLLYAAHRTVSDAEVDAELWALADAGKVDRYASATGSDVLQIVGWADLQRPQKPKASTLPPLDGTCRVRTRDGFLDTSAELAEMQAEGNPPSASDASITPAPPAVIPVQDESGTSTGQVEDESSHLVRDESARVRSVGGSVGGSGLVYGTYNGGQSSKEQTTVADAS